MAIVTQNPKSGKKKMLFTSAVDSVLGPKTGHFLKEQYELGDELGHGDYGRTFVCVDKKTRVKYACKSIAKRKLLTDEDVNDVRREIEIMSHLSSSSRNVISIRGACEKKKHQPHEEMVEED